LTVYLKVHQFIQRGKGILKLIGVIDEENRKGIIMEAGISNLRVYFKNYREDINITP